MVWQRFSTDLNRLVSGGVSSEELPKEILSVLKDGLGLRDISLYLQGPSEDYVKKSMIQEGRGTIPSDRVLNSDPLINIMRYSKAPLFRAPSAGDAEDREQELVQERMSQRSAEAAVPLLVGEELVGFLNLGPKEDGTAPTPEEVGDFSELFSHIALILQNRTLCENLRNSQARMRRKDRLALLGTLTAGLAHEIRNPLVSIKTFFQLLPEKYNDHEFRERFQKVAIHEVERISKLVEELLQFSRPAEPKFRSVNIFTLMGELLTFLESTAAERGVELHGECDDAPSPEVRCDPEQIKQILMNMAHNAFDAVDGQGTVTFRARYDREDGMEGFVHIEIEDNGVGMTPQELEKVFVPFYTTKSSGTGLGLAISRQIIEEHLGSVSVTSEPGVGTTFYLHIPKNPPSHERRKAQRLPGESDTRDMVL